MPLLGIANHPRQTTGLHYSGNQPLQDTSHPKEAALCSPTPKPDAFAVLRQFLYIFIRCFYFKCISTLKIMPEYRQRAIYFELHLFTGTEDWFAADIRDSDVAIPGLLATGQELSMVRTGTILLCHENARRLKMSNIFSSCSPPLARHRILMYPADFWSATTKRSWCCQNYLLHLFGREASPI